MSSDGTKPTNVEKWKYTLLTTLIFLIVANPLTYKLVNMLLGKIIQISDKSGCPTEFGFIIHSIVFTLLLRGIMEFDI
jgi:hypothetical protein